MLAVSGDNCLDEYISRSPSRFIGGNAANVAVHLATLGAKVAYVGVVATDLMGLKIRSSLKARGVNCSHVEVRAGETAHTWVELRDGERIIRGEKIGAQCPLVLTRRTLCDLARCEHVHASAFTSWNIDWRLACPRIVEELAALHRSGVRVSLDFSELNDPELAVFAGRFLSLGFVSRPSTSSSRVIQRTIEFFRCCGVREIVVTLGASGAVFSSEAEHFHVPARPISPVDTLGAGDAFIAGFLSKKSQGGNFRDCMEAGTSVAADACSHLGAWKHQDDFHSSQKKRC